MSQSFFSAGVACHLPPKNIFLAYHIQYACTYTSGCLSYGIALLCALNAPRLNHKPWFMNLWRIFFYPPTLLCMGHGKEYSFHCSDLVCRLPPPLPPPKKKCICDFKFSPCCVSQCFSDFSGWSAPVSVLFLLSHLCIALFKSCIDQSFWFSSTLERSGLTWSLLGVVIVTNPCSILPSWSVWGASKFLKRFS